MTSSSDETSDFSENSSVDDLRLIAGKYRLISQLGEGGMGTVWLAEQRYPVKRTVALKLIKHGMDSKAVLARFDAERQALALMNHPNIAKILDGGITDTGAPFFVMELVNGRPLTEFCDEHRFSLSERLGIFVQVCHAIQHAHQKGIIHRDIKPSNILVSYCDDVPIPKVIDFGVAKATGQTLTEHTLNTGLGLVGTPQYMSPEQANLNHLDIDTRSDVYSLGIVFYELMTGSTPFLADELKQAGYLEILRIIREEEPPKPSTKVSHSDGLREIAKRRSTEPHALSFQLRSELDWIAMKALEKDRSRRYGSASNFAEDIQRYLSGESVLAHPPSQTYRLKKLVGKHRGLVVALAGVFLTLLLGAIGTTLGLLEANRQYAEAVKKQGEAEQARDDAQVAERDALDAYRASTDDAIEDLIGAKGFLDKSQKEYLSKVRDRWERFSAKQIDGARGLSIRAEGHFRVGILLELLNDSQALTALEEALSDSLRLIELEPNIDLHDYQNAQIRVAIASCLRHKQKRAGDELTHALELYKNLAQKHPPNVEYRIRACEANLMLGRTLNLLGQIEASRQAFEETLNYISQSMIEFPMEPKLMFWESCAHGEFAAMLSESKANPKDSMFHAKKSLEIASKLCEANPHKKNQLALAQSHGGMAWELDNGSTIQEIVDAVGHHRKAVEIMRTLSTQFPSLAEFKGELAARTNDLGQTLRKIGQLRGSKESIEQVMSLKEELASKLASNEVADGGYPIMRLNLIHTMVGLGRHEEAIRIGQKSIESCRALIAKNPDYPHNCILLLDTIDIVSREMELLGQVENAVQLSEKAVADAIRFLARYDEESSQSNLAARLNIAQSNLIRVLQRSNKHAELIEAYEKQIEYYSNPEKISKYKLRLIDIHRSIASAYVLLRNSIDGIQHCDKAIELAKAVRASTTEKGNLSVVLLDILAQTLELKSSLLLLVGRNEEAIQCISEAIEMGTRNNLRHRVYRAYIQAAKGSFVEAITEADEVVNQIRRSNDLYNLACVYSMCLEHSADVQQLQETGFQNRNLGDLAIGALKAAIVSGYRDVSHMSQDVDLRSIRERNDYKSITRILSLASISRQAISNRDWKTVATQSERASKEIEVFLEVNPDEPWATTLLLEEHRRTIAAETLQNQIDSKLITIQQQVKSYRKFGQKDANADTWDIESKSRLIDYAKLATQRDEPTSVLRLLERATFLFEEPTSNNPTAKSVYCHALACRAQANVDAGRIENGLRDWDLALRSAEEPDVGEFKIRRAYAEFHKTKSAGIVDSIVELENDRKLSASALFHLACFFAKVAESTDSQTSNYHDRVWLFLDRAINRGFADLDALRSHAALDDLRNHDEYSVVFTRVEQNLVRYFP